MTERAVLLDSINPSASQEYGAAGFIVDEFPKTIKPADLRDLSEGAKILGVRSGPEVTSDVLAHSVDVVAVFGVGTSHITRRTANQEGIDDRGVGLFNSAHENTRSVAELVIASALALSRDLGDHNNSMHQGTWTKQDGAEVKGKTMGIIGYGAIGNQVATLAEALGMSVVAYDPDPRIPPHSRTDMVGSVERVLEVSDMVTLHIPGGDKNRRFIDSEKIKLMKKGSFLINAARGELVDYEAVKAAIESGHLGGLAADVYDDKNAGIKEPGKKGDAFQHVLQGTPHVLLMPHIGGSTREAQSNIGKSVAVKTLAYLSTGSTSGSVNLPNLMLGPLQGNNRLLHIHDNHPGVMAAITSMVAELNVVESHQGTRDDIGYAALDVEGEITSEVISEIEKLDATRRVRVVS